MYTPIDEMANDKLPAWKSLLLVFFPALVIFVLLDAVFITFVAGPMFQEVLSGMLRPTPDLVAGLLAWVCIVGLVYHFALPRSHTLQEALIQGAIAGLFLYGTYELTNMSVISTWRYDVVAVDMAWGSTACAIACATMFLLHGKLSGWRRM
mmetsp:Transcript_16555/g.35818  ORF Transcript_16555/g.35818 Transcript_16555/m.35818 type:complete len:151 (-) Transcript_16555:854-1306(-)